MAVNLLKQPYPNCQFFGALTYTVVINNINHNELPQDELNSFISQLQSHLYDFINNTESQFNKVIINKLLSNLSLLFISNYKIYKNPIDSLLSIIYSMNNIPLEFENDFYLQNLLPHISEYHLSLIINFISILIEDVSKKNEINNSDIHQPILDYVFKYFSIIIDYLIHLHDTTSLSPDVSFITLQSINSWVTYISIAESHSTIRYNDKVNNIVKFIFNSFYEPPQISNPYNLKLTSQSILVLTEILELNPTMLNPSMKLTLNSILFHENQWGQHFIESFIFNDDLRDEYNDEIIGFINLIIVSLQLNTLKLSKSILEPETQHILSILIKLTNLPGIPIEGESVSEMLLTFWEEFASVFVDDQETFQEIFKKSTIPNFELNFNNEKSKIFNQICLIYWSKIHLPELSIYKSIKSEFIYYRQNVADFFIVIYSLLNLTFYNDLTLGLIKTLNESNGQTNSLTDIESTLYILYKITDDSTFYESQSSILIPATKALFENNLLKIFQNLSIDDEFNHLVYSTLINYISSIEFFLKTNGGQCYLADIFNLLFIIIIKSSSSNLPSSLSLISSKTILKICQECRSVLINFLPSFEIELIAILKDQRIDHLIRQRMFNAYASIAQSIKNPHKFGEIINGIITLINEQSITLMNIPDLNQDQQDYLLSLLSCLVEIGKGCQIPDEIDDLYNDDEQNLINSFWIQDPFNIKLLILNIIERYSITYENLNQNSIVTENCCSILKIGLGESLNGPFNFDLETIFQYLINKMNISTNSNSIPHIYSLIETIIIINFKQLNDVIIDNLITKIFTEKLSILKSDPDLIKSSIDLFATILEKSPSLIIKLPIFNQVIILFAIEGLNAKETFIIKSIARFWVNFISLKKGSQQEQELVKQLIGTENQLSLNFITNLLKSFLSTSRSNLEYYYPIFRNLIAKFPMSSKKLFNLAFSNNEMGINKDKISNNTIELFINKLMITRGQRIAHDVLKKFWLATNGLIEFNTQTS